MPCQLDSSGLLEVLPAGLRLFTSTVVQDPVARLHEVGVGEEARVEERDRHAAAGVVARKRASRTGVGRIGTRRARSPGGARGPRRTALANRRGTRRTGPPPAATTGCWRARPAAAPGRAHPPAGRRRTVGGRTGSRAREPRSPRGAGGPQSPLPAASAVSGRMKLWPRPRGGSPRPRRGADSRAAASDSSNALRARDGAVVAAERDRHAGLEEGVDAGGARRGCTAPVW